MSPEPCGSSDGWSLARTGFGDGAVEVGPDEVPFLVAIGFWDLEAALSTSIGVALASLVFGLIGAERRVGDTTGWLTMGG